MTETKAAKSSTALLKPGILATELYRVLHDALLFAGKDGTLPMLNGIQLEATGTLLIAKGTDRFMLGISKAAYEGPPFTVFVSRSEVELISRALKPVRGQWKHRVAYLHVTPKSTILRVSVEATQLSVPLPTIEFPPVKQLFPGETAKLMEVPAVIGFNPEYLGKFGKVTGEQQARYFIQSPAKPMIVHVGEDFVGLIMPIRMPGEVPASYPRPDWLT